MVTLEDSLEGFSRNRVAAHEDQDSCARSYGPSHDVQVARKMAVVIFLFKLEIWKKLGKPCPFVNYCQTINSTRIVENTGQVTQPLHKPYP